MINQVVIFAGGKGTRLGVENAKCLVEVAGEPIINYIIREFSNQNVNKFHFCLGFYANKIIEHLESSNISFSYSLDPEPCCGTWKALMHALPQLDDEFFVTYGDSIAFCDLDFMYYQFKESLQNSMMSVSNYKSSQSNFCINEKNEISKGENNFVEHGVSLIKKNELIKFNKKIKNFSDFFYYRINDKIHYANANYYQINTPEDLFAANEAFNQFKSSYNYNFLDRDGTINEFDLKIYDHLKFTPTKICEILNDHDCIIITNQPGKAKKQTTLEKINFMNFCSRQYLIDSGKNIIFVNTCLHRNFEFNNDLFDKLRMTCSCRKPKTGMLVEANKRLNISKESIFYGDSDCDKECAESFGLNFIKMYN